VAPRAAKPRIDVLEALESRTLLSTYYVSPSGSDSAAGGSSAPWKSLQKAADNAKAGDIVRVGAGTYNSGMNFFGKAGGTASAPIQFLADPGAVITHSATVGTNASLAAINVENTGGYYVFKGFKISSDGSMQRGGIRIAGSSNVQVLDNTIEKAFIGIFASNGNNLLIQGNVARNSTDQHGIYVSLNTRNAVIRGNTIYGNNWDGLHMNALNGSPNDGALVEDNVIYGNELAGMDIEGVTNATFRNNIIYTNGKHGITVHSQDQANTPVAANDTWVNNTINGNGMFAIQIQSPDMKGQVLFNNVLLSSNGTYGAIGISGSASGMTSDYNVVSDNFSTTLGSSRLTRAQWTSNTGQDSHSVVATPDQVFVNAAGNDYHLKAGSLAIDKGAASLAGKAAAPDDFSQGGRPQGAGYDAGAYEYASTTPPPTTDTTAPTISGMSTSNVSSSGATANWTTNEASTTQVEYGTTTAYGSSTTMNTAMVTSHSAAMSGLAAGTTYHYRVKSRDAAGNTATSGDYTFTTAAAQDTTAPTLSGIGSSNVSNAGATVAWTTNEASDTQVEFGTTTAYGSSTTLNTAKVTSHSANLTGLTASTVYHYRVKSRDAAGNLAVSGDYTFTTTAAPTSTTVFSPSNMGDYATWTPETASRWNVAQDGGDARLFLNTTDYSELSGDRLGEYALAGSQTYGDFDMTLKARAGDSVSTNKMADYAVVFGYADDMNYSYVMLNSDAASSAIFDVVNGVRQQVASSTTAAFSDNAYHNVQVSRTGQIVSVSVDGRQVLSANDAGVAAVGRVGVGSFNDSAYFDDVNVTVPSPTSFSPVAGFGDFANYAPLTASRWSVAQDGGDTRLFLNTTDYSELSGDRLGEYALAGTRSYGDFDMTLKARTGDALSTNKMADYAVVFGYTDANNYSYAMLNADASSSAIFDVVNGVRQQVATATTSAFTDAAYHNVQVSRRGQVVTVSVDGRQILSANNAGIAAAGRVGVGSFNDSAYFDDVNVTTPVAAAAASPTVSPFGATRVTSDTVLGSTGDVLA
jgi:parallel beta-helix repeat protein